MTLGFIFFLFVNLIECVRSLHGLQASRVAWQKVVDAATQQRNNINYAEPELTEEELRRVFDSVWNNLRSSCPSLPLNHNVDVGFDDRLLNPNEPDWKQTLGYAYAAEILSGGVWSSVLRSQAAHDYASQLGTTTMGVMRVGRSKWLPGGWFRGSGTCFYKFRLEDVLRHEIIHLLGVSATVRVENNVLYVGKSHHGICFPGVFDRAIKNKHGEQVVTSSCEFTANLGQENIFVNEVTLFQAEQFLPGTSVSHLRSLDSMMTPSIDYCNPDGVKPLTTLDKSVLDAIGVNCNANSFIKKNDGRFERPNFLPFEPKSVHAEDTLIEDTSPNIEAPTDVHSQPHPVSHDTEQNGDSNDHSDDLNQKISPNSGCLIVSAALSQWATPVLLVLLTSAILACPFLTE